MECPKCGNELMSERPMSGDIQFYCTVCDYGHGEDLIEDYEELPEEKMDDELDKMPGKKVNQGD